MKFTKIQIFTKEENTELLISDLTDLGADGVEIRGDAELEQIIDSADPDMIDREVRDLRDEPVSVTVYIPDNEQGRGVVRNIEDFLHGGNLEYTVSGVAEEDWENNWKKYFKPFTVGKRLIVKPSWEDSDSIDNLDNAGSRTVLEIDPASAFGTGQHATTRMCLELLEERVREGDRVFDIGCGSGILSAAAGLLGAYCVAAIDISENAERITVETLEKNGIENYSVNCGNLISDEYYRNFYREYDIVVANITADIIIAMSEFLPRYVGGVLILSGIIAPRLDEVREAIGRNFTVEEVRESEGWNALLCVKK
ncbi:MAG: 50S ribosomal protein L11 methyltransferase [Oscillospiraceae bacterium]|nr:50S ribosomal protein L11 methyltransferase [Oscillospiraceae bacterium]